MREYNGKLAGKDLQLVANFKASMEIAEQVADPILISREATLEAMMIEAGMTYHPRWSFSVENIPLILYIGLKQSDTPMKMTEVQDLVFEAGFGEAKELCVEYLGMIIGPGPAEEVARDGDEDNGSGN